MNKPEHDTVTEAVQLALDHAPGGANRGIARHALLILGANPPSDFKTGLMMSTDLPVRSKGGRVEFGADATMPVGGHAGKIPGLHVTELQPGTGWPGITKDDFPVTMPAAWDGVEDAQLAEKRAVRDLGIIDGEGSGHAD